MNPAPVVIESAVSVTKSNTPPKNVFTTKNAWKFKVALVMLAVVFLYFTIMKMNKKKKASLSIDIVNKAAPADGKANNDSRPPPEKVQ
jgi:hypothetical protein